METATLVKGGENVMMITLSRSIRHTKQGVGLVVHIKTLPIVEDFMRSLSQSDGLPQPGTPVGLFGRHWVSLDASTTLTVCPIPEPMLGVLGHDPNKYRLDIPGRPMLLPDNDRGGDDILNMSMLRLTGISQNAGVTFGVSGVYDLETIQSLHNRLAQAARAFYSSYMKPLAMSVIVSTQEYTPADRGF